VTVTAVTVLAAVRVTVAVVAPAAMVWVLAVTPVGRVPAVIETAPV